MKIQIRTLKYISSFCFIIPGLYSLIQTLITEPEYWIRDFIILFILSLPLIINRRFFYIGYGILTGIISLALTFVFAFKNVPTQKDFIIPYLLGIAFFLIILSSSLTMIYIGTFSKEKGRFRLA